MASLVFSTLDADDIRPVTPLEAILAGFRLALDIRREQRAILKLSRLDNRMLEDIGFDPAIIRSTRRDVWARFE